MEKDFLFHFSAPTRQKRTSLVLSSVSLILTLIFVRANFEYEIPIGGISVSGTSAAVMFLFATIYFAISFLFSARREHKYISGLRSLGEVKSFLQQFETWKSRSVFELYEKMRPIAHKLSDHYIDKHSIGESADAEKFKAILGQFSESILGEIEIEILPRFSEKDAIDEFLRFESDQLASERISITLLDYIGPIVFASASAVLSLFIFFGPLEQGFLSSSP